MGSRARIIELYAGIGTISFALVLRAAVTTYEGDGAVHAALQRAAGGTRVEVRHRDLARMPVPARELGTAACVVLDPPHAGAARQVAEIAASRVGRVIYVSCNPATLARDAAMLRAAGYALAAVTPIDQFLWSARLESVTVFARSG